MDAFLKGGDDSTAVTIGFMDSQIQSLLSVCITLVEHPILLYQPGLSYHMITNASILLGHLLNLMSKTFSTQPRQEGMEKKLFEEMLDTYITTRSVVKIHWRTLPVKLRCHCLPHPNLFPTYNNKISQRPPVLPQPMINMEEVLTTGGQSATAQSSCRARCALLLPPPARFLYSCKMVVGR